MTTALQVASEALGVIVLYWLSAYAAGNWVKIYWKARGPNTTSVYYRDPVKVIIERGQ